MAKYDWRFFEKEVFCAWQKNRYEDLDDDEKFEKLYRYVLDLEDRIEQLEDNQ